jgi:2-oxoglutarate dehydrogenase complex dehydrogenase (E1) component-like enzyme
MSGAAGLSAAKRRRGSTTELKVNQENNYNNVNKETPVRKITTLQAVREHNIKINKMENLLKEIGDSKISEDRIESVVNKLLSNSDELQKSLETAVKNDIRKEFNSLLSLQKKYQDIEKSNSELKNELSKLTSTVVELNTTVLKLTNK